MAKLFLATLRYFLCGAAIALFALPAAAGPVLGSLNLWLSADNGVTTSGGQVVSWADQSGMGHNAIAGFNGPTFVGGALNGLPVLRFDGATQNLFVSGQVLTSQQFTIMAVVNDTRSPGDPSFREVFSNWSGVNTTTSVFLGTTNSNPLRARFTDDMGGATDPLHFQQGVGTIANPATHFIFSGVSDTTDATIYQNGSLIASNGAPLSSRDLTTPYAIGSQGQNPFEFWQGDIAEILVYDRALSSSELQQNWDYLNGKYFGAAVVPEPASFALLGIGSLGLIGLVRRRLRVS